MSGAMWFFVAVVGLTGVAAPLVRRQLRRDRANGLMLDALARLRRNWPDTAAIRDLIRSYQEIGEAIGAKLAPAIQAMSTAVSEFGATLQKAAASDALPSRRLWLWIQYEGPWERLHLLLIGVDRKHSRVRREVRDGSLRERLATRAEKRDFRWRDRYARSGRDPHRVWSRKTREEQD